MEEAAMLDAYYTWICPDSSTRMQILKTGQSSPSRGRSGKVEALSRAQAQSDPAIVRGLTRQKWSGLFGRTERKRQMDQTLQKEP
ncbi:uncharacterized protein ACNS7B_000816 isoform 2-T4 [Menidia menidia]